MEEDDVEDDDVKGEEEDDVENDEVEEEEDDDTEDADAEEDRSQDHAACFVRACAVEMQVAISQKPLYTEIYRKNAAAQIDPRTRTHTLCEPAQSKCTSTFRKMPAPRVSTLIKRRPLLLP